MQNMQNYGTTVLFLQNKKINGTTERLHRQGAATAERSDFRATRNCATNGSKSWFKTSSFHGPVLRKNLWFTSHVSWTPRKGHSGPRRKVTKRFLLVSIFWATACAWCDLAAFGWASVVSTADNRSRVSVVAVCPTVTGGGDTGGVRPHVFSNQGCCGSTS